MAKELYVSSTPHETKVAVVEEDQLSEIYFERENEYTLAGSIYKGRVTRVLPGMQSAFVNIGLERDAFLYVSDFLMEEDEDSDAISEAVASSRNSPIIEVRSYPGTSTGRLRRRKSCRRLRSAMKKMKAQSRNPPRAHRRKKALRKSRSAKARANGADAAAAEEADVIVSMIAAQMTRQPEIVASRRSQ